MEVVILIPPRLPWVLWEFVGMVLPPAVVVLLRLRVVLCAVARPTTIAHGAVWISLTPR